MAGDDEVKASGDGDGWEDDGEDWGSLEDTGQVSLDLLLGNPDYPVHMVQTSGYKMSGSHVTGDPVITRNPGCQYSDIDLTQILPMTSNIFSIHMIHVLPVYIFYSELYVLCNLK